jgi:hypothetical protein
MTSSSEDHDAVAGPMWAANEEPGAAPFDEDCSPTRVCRNAREFTFEGIASDGGDLQAAWRDTLQREGKFNGSGGSLRELVFGQSTAN